jgi:predicted negative regulator of RcsB-dependent stress response
VDEYLTEKEQIERIKQWWRENGWFLIGGALLASGGYFGYNQYQAYQDRIAEDAAALYQEFVQVVEDDDRAQADALLARLEADYASSAYTDQAHLLIAQDYLIRDTGRAIEELTQVVEQSRDEGMVRIARLRLARVLAYDEQYDLALATLNVPEPGQFESRYAEVRGDIHAAAGNIEAAIDSYTDALLGAGSAAVNTEFLQLKQNELRQLSVARSSVTDTGDDE